MSDVGRDYTYHYQVEALTALKGASDQQSSLVMGAKATFTPTSTCNFVLKVHIFIYVINQETLTVF